MILRDLLALAREWLDDEAQPYLWSDRTLARYFDEAQREAALRARLLVDSRTPALTHIDVAPGTASYPLAPGVIVARRIEYRAGDGSRRYAVRRTSAAELDRTMSRWMDRTGPHPEYVVQDLEQRELRLVPAPTVPGTLTLTVWRYPLATESLLDANGMPKLGAEPVLEPHYHAPLAHWVCARAFQHKDAETDDKQAWQEHMAQFVAVFGEAPTAAALRALAVDRSTTLRSYTF